MTMGLPCFAEINWYLYLQDVQKHIQSEWVIPKPGDSENLITIVDFEIDSDCKAHKFHFKRRSGRSFLDNAALQAIKKRGIH